MSILIRLSYASDSKSRPEHVRHDLLKTLNEISVYHIEAPVYGVLYDINDTIFHCIEGKKTEVDQLYRQLLLRTRHHRMTLLDYEQIDTLSITQLASEHLMKTESILDCLQLDQTVQKQSFCQLSPPTLTKIAKPPKIFEGIKLLPKEPFTPSLKCINSFFVFSTLLVALILSFTSKAFKSQRINDLTFNPIH